MAGQDTKRRDQALKEPERTRKNTREAGKQTCGAGNKPFQKCNKQIQKDGIFGETDKVQRKTKEDFWTVF